MKVGEEMIAKVQELFATKLHLEIPSPETDLIEEGLLDSILLVDVLLHIEQDFGVEVSLEELELDAFRSVRSIAAYLATRLAPAIRQAVGEG